MASYSGNFGSAYPYAVGAQSQNKIIVAGSTSNSLGNQNALVLRYNADGSLDPSFGSGGFFLLDLPGSKDELANGLAISSDQKLILTGYSGDGVTDSVMVFRLNP